ncbi:hypothetical protein OG864_29715 [Streptomyces sp. NBC_00124]|uniref:hypothetical protein n=1 Tax=Streptomyces sp. NBC_00124 TaxID=2975662 RepID=UPI0022583CA4|nr:hypothetical protein [Streptomyces sp. NBC_00124]MCX5362879.1 hypothetical protein [Streptomyces sp. NBC_00124]
MTALPAWLLRHTITVEPYRGTGAYGEVFGDPAAAAALVAETVKHIRDATGAITVSTAQVYAGPTLDCPVGSRVMLPDGRITRALTVAHHTAPGLPVPQSTEVYCE